MNTPSPARRRTEDGRKLAPQVADNPIPIALYHTHWTASRTMEWLDGLVDDADWFCWMSFPIRTTLGTRRAKRPNVSIGGIYRCPIAILVREKCLEVLAEKPRHWTQWYTGEAQFAFEVPPTFVPAETTADRIREVNAMVHAENELIDEAIGQVLAYVKDRGWDADTEIIFTTDHGEFQGDFGMLFKGPYHIEALMHVPLIWRPAPARGIVSAAVNEPVGHVDIAPTMVAAGLPVPVWMQGAPFPQANGEGRERTITEWYDTWDGNMEPRPFTVMAGC